jgi:hypothetical protein
MSTAIHRSLAVVTAAAVLVFTLAGCNSAKRVSPTKMVQPDRLAFLVDGKVTRTEVLQRLGPPDLHIERDKIYAYRIAYAKTPGGLFDYIVMGRFPSPDDWRWVTFSLVVVFDDAGLLVRHSLVPLHEEGP